MTVDTTSSSKSTPPTATAGTATAATPAAAATAASTAATSQPASAAQAVAATSQSYASPPHVFKKNRNEVVRTIQEITKFDEFTINQAIEACQDREGLYSMDQVLNILMDEKYSNEYQHQDSGGSAKSSSGHAGYRSQNDEATTSKYGRGTASSTSKANNFGAGNMYSATNNLDDEDDDEFDTPASPSSNLTGDASSSSTAGAGVGSRSGHHNDSNLYREDGKPAGLKNVGNTCWFNSIIQAFFHLPAFRRLILTFQIDPEDMTKLDENSKNVVNFVVELRKLFALMYKSKRRAINPNNTLRFLRNCSKYDVDTFNQEDVSEFATILVNLIEESFDVLAKLQRSGGGGAPQTPGSVTSPASASDEAIIEKYLASLNLNAAAASNQTSNLATTTAETAEHQRLNITNSNLINFRKNRKNPIVNLLNGDMLISRKNLDEDTTNYIIEIFREVNIQMLNSRNLHAGLELEWGETSIDKLSGMSATSSESTATKSAAKSPSTSMNRSFYEQESWLLKLPSVLFVCLNRYKFVKATQSSSKIIEPFEFYPHIYLDRYMHANKELIKAKRKELKALNNDLKRLEDKLESISKYQYATAEASREQQAGLALDQVLKCVLHFAQTDHSASDVFAGIKDTGGGESAESSLQVVNKCLGDWIRRTEAKISELKERIDKVKHKIASVYDEEGLKRVRYHLHSVCIHEGSATLGHFWTYIWNKQQSKWYKFNDTEVSETTWDDLYANAVGGASAIVSGVRSQQAPQSGQDAAASTAAAAAASKTAPTPAMNLTLDTQEMSKTTTTTTTTSSSTATTATTTSDKTPSAYFLIYTKDDESEAEEAASSSSFEMAPDLTRLLAQDQETLDQQIYSARLKHIFRDLCERLKKSNQAIANLNYQQQNSDQHYQTCLEHAKTFSDSTTEALAASFDRILSPNAPPSSSSCCGEYGPEEALKHAIEHELKKYTESPKDILSRLPETDARIQHIVTYFSANGLSRDLRVLALLDIFRIQIFSDAETRVRILQTMAQIKYNEYVKAHASSSTASSPGGAISPPDLIKTYEKWQLDYRDYRSIIAAFVNAASLLEAHKYEEATPFFCVTAEYNERITSNLQLKMKGMDHEFLLAIRRKCLKQWNQSTIRKFTQSTTNTNTTTAAGVHHHHQQQQQQQQQQQPSQLELTTLIETMSSKFLPCFFRLATSTPEDKAMIEEIRRDWLAVLDSNLPEMTVFHEFMTKLFEEPLANHYHSLNVNKMNLIARYKETTSSLHLIRPH